MQPELTYETLDSMTKQWGPERTYGGKLVENFTQACGRELMADAMVRADERGVPVGMSIHDELVVENRTEDPYDHKNLEALMCELPAWAVGLPIAAEGWTGRRYSK
jgi:DNA polymerase